MFNEKIIPPLSQLKKDASDNYWYSPAGASYSPDEIFNHALQLETELAGMELMEAEGESFGETIVRENEKLKAELATIHAWNITPEASALTLGEAIMELQDKLHGITKQLQQAQKERDALVNDTDVLVELLKEYGDHHWTCDSTHGTGLPCDCVYGATLEKYATRKKIEVE